MIATAKRQLRKIKKLLFLGTSSFPAAKSRCGETGNPLKRQKEKKPEAKEDLRARKRRRSFLRQEGGGGVVPLIKKGRGLGVSKLTLQD